MLQREFLDRYYPQVTKPANLQDISPPSQEDARRVARPGIQIVDGSPEVLAEIALRERDERGQRLSDATTLVHEQEKVEVGKEVGKANGKGKGKGTG